MYSLRKVGYNQNLDRVLKIVQSKKKTFVIV